MAMSDEETPRDPTLSRAYREGAKAEPPPALDALILAAARQEAGGRASPVRAPWWRRALVPVGLLATLVVTVSIALMVGEQEGEPLPAAAPAPPMAADQAPKAVAPAEPMAKRAAPSFASPPTAPAASVMTPGATPQNYAKPAAQADGTAALERRAETRVPAAAAPLPAQEAGELREGARGVQPGRAAERVGKTEASRTPAQWIEEIRRLRQVGDEVAARAQLAAFRRAYPDYPLPDDLKQQ